ncbi:hypothetical protein D6U78_09530 [Vibrio cholerae]|nr:hypothetical protein [Vibrio cholerae]MVF55128.1 hypothetical protein [Vibrio cholerae]
MKIKKLQFQVIPGSKSFIADTPFCRYQIYSALRDSWCAEIKFGNHCVCLINETGITVDQAIATCQMDFESRLLECFEIKMEADE